MLDMFKRKLKVDDLAKISTRVTVKVFTVSDLKIRQLLDELEETGADSDALHLELGAFNVFLAWCGATRALQERRLTPMQFERFNAVSRESLVELLSGSPTDMECIRLRDCSIEDFVDERVEVLAAITSDAPPAEVLMHIVDKFCSWIHFGTAPIQLRLSVQSIYFLTASSVLDMTKASRIID